MLKQILPHELHDTKFIRGVNDCSYSTSKKSIVFNRTYLIKYCKIIWLALNKLLNRTLTKKEFLICCLLHELGHKYDDINSGLDISLYNREMQHIQEHCVFESVEGKIKYWTEVYAEQKATIFMIDHFRKYLELQNKNKLT
jgi:hypothetical protein